MHSNWHESSGPSHPHSNEVEHRLTKVETTSEDHAERITFLERALKAMIYAIGVLSASKTGEAAELLLSVLKKT